MRLACLALLLAACTQRTQLFTGDAGAVCSGSGTPISLSSSTCAATAAANALDHAVCSCQSLLLAGNLTTEDGPRPPMQGGHGPMVPAAAVGTNGSLQVGGQAQIAGTVEATGGMSFGDTASVFGNLRSDGSVSATQLLAVGGDAFVGGDVLGRVDVGGTLHVSPTSDVAPSVNAHDVSTDTIAPVMPCDCGVSPVDVAGLVASARATNDDFTIALDPDATPTAATLSLPCGSYFLSSLTASGVVELDVHGRTALFVGGDVDVGGLRVVLDYGAELDLVIAGNLTAAGDVGSADTASSVRVWLGGGTLRLLDGGALSAEVYAPSATLLADGSLSLMGSLFVGGASLGGDLLVRFDPRVLAGGSECGDPPVSPID